MSRRRIPLLGLCLAMMAALWLGCGANDVARDSRPAEAKSKGGEKEPSPPPQLPPPETADEAEAPPPVDSPAEPPPADSAYRLLLLTTPGPLLVEVRISVNGRPADAMLEELLDEALSAADAGGDGAASWDELLANPLFQQGQYGNAAVTDENRGELAKNYDVNRDGRVDRREMALFLSQNRGDWRAFSLSSTGGSQGGGLTDSPIWRVLDADGDHQLSASELESAERLLRLRDWNDDGVVFAADLADDPAEAMGRGSSFGPPAAVQIASATDWRQLFFTLQEVYSFGGPLGPAELSAFGEAFAKLDADENTVFSSAELQGLEDAPPHVELRLSFGAESSAKSDGGVSIQILTGSIPQDAVVQIADGRQELRLAGLFIQFVRAGDPPLGEGQAAALFAQFDADGNGYLEEDEVPSEELTLGAGFETLDEDGDGKVFPSEINAWLERREAINRRRIQAAVAQRSDMLLAHLDVDGDRRLTPRELAAAGHRLAELDVGGDGRLQPGEIPAGLSITFSRGNSGMTSPAAPPAVLPAAIGDAPAWFLRMDANGDGEIDRREFLGKQSDFDRLDADCDGFIEGEEAGGE